jgi:hypothetical protein
MARACRDDLPDGQSGIFLQKGLDRDGTQATDLPVGQITRPYSAAQKTDWLKARPDEGLAQV